MSEKAWRVDWQNRIGEYVAHRWTDKSVFLEMPKGIQRRSISSQYERFFRTREEAVQAILTKLTLEVDRAKIALNNARSRLGQFKADERLK